MAGVELEHQRVHVNGVDLHVVTAGEGPPVLLLHGFPENSYSWRKQLEPLVRAGFRVVVPDLRGYHESDKPAGVAAYHLDELVNDVVGLVRWTGAPRAHLVGHDWGGIIAWATAIRRPDVIDRLVVMNAPHPRVMLREARRPRQLAKSAYAFFFQLPALPERVISARRFLLVRRLLARDPVHEGAFTSEDIERYVEALSRPGALTAALNYYRALRDPEALRWLRRAGRVEAPTLVVWGMRDLALGPWLLDGLERWVPDLRVHRIEDASHWVQNDAPDEVNEALLGFLGRPKGRRAEARGNGVRT